MKRKILLTFDIEEFDLPLEYNCSVPESEQITRSLEGAILMSELLSKYQAVSTFFTTSYFAELNPDFVKNQAKMHEIASHTYRHSKFEEIDIEKSKLDLERISGKKVSGFRMPRLQKIDYKRLISAGYSYDSSLNPTFLPGRYNHFGKPRTRYQESESGLTILPMSVSPVIRFPLFWLSFKNIPLPLYFAFCRQCLAKDGYLHLYFHPWEFTDLSGYPIPSYIKKISGDEYLARFERLLSFLQNQGEFSSISDFLDGYK